MLGQDSDALCASGCTYMEQALSIVVVGASGDLAKKKTFPALYDLYTHGFLPEHTKICGFARSEMTDEQLRTKLRPFLEKIKDLSPDGECPKCFWQVFYKNGGYADAAAMKGVADQLLTWEQEHGSPIGNRVYYFAIPPTVFLDTAKIINSSGMAPNGWTRLIVEKPFGHDYGSALELSDGLKQYFQEHHIYRIDHYLGKEMVQNLLCMRFSNKIFEPIWNRDHISAVIFTFKENFGTEGRGGYFDKFGIIRDIIQNHLMQVFSLLAMEAPVRVSGTDYSNYIRDAKVASMAAIEPIRLDECVIGQYEGTGDEPGYQDDPGVPKGSLTPTFATVVVRVNNPRWEGVPFIFKAGKALNERKAEVRIQLRQPAGSGFMFDNEPVPRNELVMRLQPSESIYLKANVKAPGLNSHLLQSELDLTYGTRYPDEYSPDAYTRLILEVLRGQQATFVRRDELLASWKVFTPLLKAIEAGEVPMHNYKFGTRGPAESDELMSKVGFIYHSNYTWVDVPKESSKN
ncbi:unnamed protein product, partial [Chrysoparadoxa australica]